MAVPTPALSHFNRPFDALLQLQDDATQITSSGNGSVGGSSVIRDLGDGVVSAEAVIDVNTIDTTTGDESYLIHIQGSTSSSFASGVVNLATLFLGGASATGETVASSIATTKRFILPFHNAKYGTLYRYVRIRFVLAGTTPILDAECYVAPARTLGA